MENEATKQIVTIDSKGLALPELNEINRALETKPAQFEIRIIRLVELEESFPETRSLETFVAPHLGLVVTALSAAGAIAGKKAIEFIVDRIEQVLNKRAARKEEELETAVLYQPDGKILISFKKPKTPSR